MKNLDKDDQIYSSTPFEYDLAIEIIQDLSSKNTHQLLEDAGNLLHELHFREGDIDSVHESLVVKGYMNEQRLKEALDLLQSMDERRAAKDAKSMLTAEDGCFDLELGLGGFALDASVKEIIKVTNEDSSAHRSIISRPEESEQTVTSVACADKNPDLFFSYAPKQIEQAKTICNSCSKIDSCLAVAMADPSINGIWGGTTEDERRALRRRSKRK